MTFCGCFRDCFTRRKKRQTWKQVAKPALCHHIVCMNFRSRRDEFRIPEKGLTFYDFDVFLPGIHSADSC